MIFKPQIVARLWDTWLYYHAGTHYLFYLHRSRAGGGYDGISVATSDDGVHFADRGPIIHKATDANWLGTGMVWRAGDQFMLNFSEERNGVQEIFFAESDDLLHWRRLPDEEYVCRTDPRWYAESPMFTSQRWDCIWVLPRDDGPGYIGFLTAVAKDGPPGLCGTAGCVVSADGRHFSAAPPVIETGFWGERIEVGAVEKIGGRYYMLLGVGKSHALGSRHLSDLLAGECGMYVLSSQSQTGPYRLDPGQRLLLGNSPKRLNYFARFYRCGDQLLLNHHTVPRQPGGESYFSPLKTVHCDATGILSLHWWPGNEALRGRPLPVLLEGCDFYGLRSAECPVEAGRLHLAAAAGGLAILPVKYDLARGVILEAELTFHASRGPLGGVGFFIEGGPIGAGTLFLAQSDDRLTVGPYSSPTGDGYAFQPEDAKPLPFKPEQTMRWRLLLRNEFAELYVDDELIQGYTLPHVPAGRLGFVIEAGTATVANIRGWEMSL